MKFLKYFVLVLVALVAIALIYGAILPNKATVTQSVSTKADPQRVFYLINDLKNWSAWSEWRKADPKAKYTYSEQTRGKGAWMAWEGKEVGKGKLTVTAMVPNKKLEYTMEFMEPWTSVSNGFIELNNTDEQLTITWQDVVELPNLISRLFFKFGNVEEQIAQDFQKNMLNMAGMAEGFGPVPAYDIRPEKRPALRIFGHRETVSGGQEMNQAFVRMYTELYTQLYTNGLKPDSNHWVTAIYHSYQKDTSDVEAAIAFKSPFPESFESSYAAFRDLESTSCLFTEHRGPYETMEKAYEALKIHLVNHAYVEAGPPMEVYVTDPEKEPNPEEWITWIYWPVQSAQ
jgi:effector-binding domain-containing protein/uncharacterized protein YndB with AHSA1/START domain